MTKNQLDFFEERFIINLDSICIFRKAQSRVNRTTLAYEILEKKIQDFYGDLGTFLRIISQSEIEKFYRNYLSRFTRSHQELEEVSIRELRDFEIALNILKLNKLQKSAEKRKIMSAV